MVRERSSTSQIISMRAKIRNFSEFKKHGSLHNGIKRQMVMRGGVPSTLLYILLLKIGIHESSVSTTHFSSMVRCYDFPPIHFFTI